MTPEMQDPWERRRREEKERWAKLIAYVLTRRYAEEKARIEREYPMLPLDVLDRLLRERKPGTKPDLLRAVDARDPLAEYRGGFRKVRRQAQRGGLRRYSAGDVPAGGRAKAGTFTALTGIGTDIAAGERKLLVSTRRKRKCSSS